MRRRRKVGRLRAALAVPTLGGLQLWADLAHAGGWRLQRHARNGRFRVLDPKGWRRGLGEEAEMRERFAALTRDVPRPEAEKPTVILLHGLTRSRRMFKTLEPQLRRAGYHPIALSYPSTRQDLAAHAAGLDACLDTLAGDGPLAFVTFSLGALVLRRAIADRPAWLARRGVSVAVMIAPPNRGARLASRVRNNKAMRMLLGPSMLDCTPERAMELGLPDFPVCVIAGGTGRNWGVNPFISGDNDLVVGLDETRLAEEHPFTRITATHGLLARHPRTGEAVLTYLAAHAITQKVVAAGAEAPAKAVPEPAGP